MDIKDFLGKFIGKSKITDTQKSNSKRELERDYMRDWVLPKGKEYRDGVYARQKKDGWKPLVSNPTFTEIRKELNKYKPNKVLEIGCGWGRIMNELQKDYDIEGCDVSNEYLKLCDPKLKVFYHDIAVKNNKFNRKNKGRWDVLFTRGVMLYFMEVPTQMKTALKNLEKLANKKVIFWEWPEVCEKMKATYDSPKFDYQIIEHRSE